MKKELRKILIEYLVVVGIFSIFNTVWQQLEIHYYGEIQERVVDTIICMPVVLLIYYNVHNWLKDLFKEDCNE